MDETSLPPVPDLEPSYGEPVQLEGRCEIDPIPGGKRLQGTWLVLDDGTRYVISYRPERAYFQFADKRVVVRGRPMMPGSDVQHVLTMHLTVESIVLAPGEVPYGSPPEQLPAPPLVKTAAALAALDGRWAQVAGVLESVRKDPDGYLSLASLRLADGAEIVAFNVPQSEWERYVGMLVTVVSRVGRPEDGEQAALGLVGWYAICEGETARCEMDRAGEKDVGDPRQ